MGHTEYFLEDCLYLGLLAISKQNVKSLEAIQMSSLHTLISKNTISMTIWTFCYLVVSF